MTLPLKERAAACVPLLFTVGLSTFDSGYDLYLGTTAVLLGQFWWGCAILAPVFLNLAFTAWTWYCLEKNRWTLVFLITFLWPQYRALGLIYRIGVKGDEAGLEKKKEFYHRIGCLEPLIEAIPQENLQIKSCFTNNIVTSQSASKYNCHSFIF